MGSFRFTKRIKILPGLTLNLNKQSVSLTTGVRGAHATINSKGYRTLSAGIPGTGLSYRDTRKVGGTKPTTTKAAPAPKPQPDPEPIEVWWNVVGNTVLKLLSTGREGAEQFELFAIDTAADNTWWRVGIYTDHYAAGKAALQWEAWIRDHGGSVAAWLAHP